MLNSNNYSSVQASITGNFSKYMPIMMQFKSTIQRVIIPLLSANELQDIRDSQINMNVIEKLAHIGKTQYQKSIEHTDETLYCLCMAIGTIIKEYDLGNKYIPKEGMCDMSQRITSPKNTNTNMYRPTEMEISIYAMAAEMNDKYNQSNTSRGIAEEAELWARDFSMLTEEQLCDKAVEFTRKNIREMNWSEDDIEGVTWFLGIYVRVILKAGLSQSFASIMMTSLRKYYNVDKI